jgi:hypothetical protein
MAHLHLPAQHSEQDFLIAGAIARALRSEDLYVTWSSQAGPARPIIPSAVTEPCEARRRRGIGRLIDALARRRLL